MWKDTRRYVTDAGSKETLIYQDNNSKQVNPGGVKYGGQRKIVKVITVCEGSTLVVPVMGKMLT